MTTPRVSPARLGARLIRAQPGRYSVNALLWTAIWVMPIVPGFIIQAYFDRIADTGRVGLSVDTLIVLLVAYGLGRLAVMGVGMWNDIHFMFRNGALLRRNMLARVYDLPGAQALAESPGEALSRFREDVEETEESISWTVDLIGLMSFAVLAFVVLTRVDAVVTALVFAPTIVVVWVSAQARHRIRRYREAAREATGRITESLGETFGSVQAIKVAGAEESMIRHMRQLNDRRRSAMVRDKVLTTSLESVFWNTVSIGTGIVLIVAAGEMRTGEFTVGDFALFVYFLTFVSEAVFVLGLFIARYQQARVAFGRMLAVMQTDDHAALVAQHDLHLTGELPAPDVVPAHYAPLTRLELRGLTYRYPGSDNGVEGVSFTMERGMFTVVTGRIGAGKTTLLRTVLGLVPASSGQVLWNGDVVDDPASFFVPPRSAYTPQVPRLFSMSLRANLLMGRRDQDAALSAAMQAAIMEHDLEHMPEGLATMVGPLGVRLSGGQVQRSAAARMFVRTPDLLVFDDVSSALDVETEKLLWERLFATRSGVTTLVVSHRRPALQRADQIVVMEGGRVAAIGRVDALLEGSDEFRRLWERESLT